MKHAWLVLLTILLTACGAAPPVDTSPMPEVTAITPQPIPTATQRSSATPVSRHSTATHIAELTPTTIPTRRPNTTPTPTARGGLNTGCYDLINLYRRNEEPRTFEAITREGDAITGLPFAQTSILGASGVHVILQIMNADRGAYADFAALLMLNIETGTTWQMTTNITTYARTVATFTPDGRVMWIDEGQLWLAQPDGSGRSQVAVPEAVRSMADVGDGLYLLKTSVDENLYSNSVDNRLYWFDAATNQVIVVEGTPPGIVGLGPDHLLIRWPEQQYRLPREFGAAGKLVSTYEHLGHGGFFPPPAYLGGDYWALNESIAGNREARFPRYDSITGEVVSLREAFNLEANTPDPFWTYTAPDFTWTVMQNMSLTAKPLHPTALINIADPTQRTTIDGRLAAWVPEGVLFGPRELHGSVEDAIYIPYAALDARIPLNRLGPVAASTGLEDGGFAVVGWANHSLHIYQADGSLRTIVTYSADHCPIDIALVDDTLVVVAITGVTGGASVENLSAIVYLEEAP